jgi:hypothetical protein
MPFTADTLLSIIKMVRILFSVIVFCFLRFSLQSVLCSTTKDKSLKDYPAKSMIGPEFSLDGFTGSLARTNHKKNHWHADQSQPSQPVRQPINK